MGGTTPALALPYPTGTDRVADGDNAIQALAQKLDAIALGVWVPITLGPSINALAGFQPPQCVRLPGGLVTCQGLLSSSTGLIAAHPLGTLPAGYRPAGALRFVTQFQTGGNQFATINVDAAGAITYESGGVGGSNIQACSLAPIIFRIG